MAKITPTNKSVASFKGLHLYHGDISNCSMRVRMTLTEKSLDWTSHHIDLMKKEQISDEYFGINPNGLVPTLVHDGVVHIESNDIIDYLDQTFPNPPLRVKETEAVLLEWLRLAGSIHLTGLKPYVYGRKLQPKLKKTQAEEDKYKTLQTNEDLKEFHSKHSGAKTLGGEDIAKAEAILNDCFRKLDVSLEGNSWIMGEQFTLADISWIPVHFVLVGCGYPFEDYPNVSRWVEAVKSRPSYHEAITKWCSDFSKV